MKKMKEVLKTLPDVFRIKIARIVFERILLAALDVISVAAFLPVLFGLRENSSPLGWLEKFSASISLPVAGICVVAFFILKNILALWITQNQSGFISDVSITLSKELHTKFYQQSWMQYASQNSSETARIIKTTSSDFSHYMVQGLISVSADSFLCISMVIFLMIFNYQVVILTGFLVVPIVLIYYLFKKNTVRKINVSFRDLTPRASVVLAQGIDSFADAKIYKKENFFIDRFLAASSTTGKLLAKLKTLAEVPPRLFETVGIICIVTIFIYADQLTATKTDLVVLVGLFSLALYRVIPSLNRILIHLDQMQVYSYTIAEIQNNFKTVTTERDTRKICHFNREIKIEGLSFQYDNNIPVIRNLNFSINKGEFILVKGVSGAGKTTLLHILSGLITALDGKILIDGDELNEEIIASWQKKLGFVPQNPVILNDTLIQNIAFGEKQECTDVEKVNKIIAMTQLTEVVKEMANHIHTMIGENGLNLSGGQKQRVALARALYFNPEVLLLDEVTNQLDDSAKLKILDMLRELTEHGCTIILASHDTVVQQYASRVLEIDEVYHNEGATT